MLRVLLQECFGQHQAPKDEPVAWKIRVRLRLEDLDQLYGVLCFSTVRRGAVRPFVFQWWLVEPLGGVSGEACDLADTPAGGAVRPHAAAACADCTAYANQG
ncbi:unnamed protein product [Boreogadus saida]